jgi:hypothetical protein
MKIIAIDKKGQGHSLSAKIPGHNGGNLISVLAVSWMPWQNS